MSVFWGVPPLWVKGVCGSLISAAVVHLALKGTVVVAADSFLVRQDFLINKDFLAKKNKTC